MRQFRQQVLQKTQEIPSLTKQKRQLLMKVPIIDTNLKNVTLSINIHTNLSYKLIIMVWISLFYLYEYVRAYQTYLIASPHSGQNFGCSEESFGFHPHFTQRVSMESTGLLAPHSVQNFPLFKAPHIHFQINVLGFSAPHTEQKLPVHVSPQLHFHSSKEFCDERAVSIA